MALITLRAGATTAVIDPDHGSMLSSLAVDGRELLVQRSEEPAPIPTDGCFLMAPWVAEIAEGRIDLDGATHRLPVNVGRHAVHGLVFDRPWTTVTTGTDATTLECALASPWPFGGYVRQTFRLEPAGLGITAEIGGGHTAMPVSLGWHPWFRVADPHAVAVRVDADAMLELDEELLPTGRILPVAGLSDLRAGPRIGDREIDTVYVGVTEPAEVMFPDGVLRIESDPSFSLVVVYVSPGAVCVEPWSAWPDALRMSQAGHATGVSILEPGEKLQRWTRWSWSPHTIRT